MPDDRVVITAVGPVTPVGVGRAELAAALAEGLEPVEIGQLNVEDYLASAKTYLDPNSAYALCSAALALKDARLTVNDDNAASVGVSFGTRLANVTTVESYLKMLREQGVKLASPLLFIHGYPNTSVSLSAIEFGIKGTSFNFNSGRFAGLQALIQAADELGSGGMSVMLAGAADTYTEVTRAAALGAPFGAAMTLALERLEGASARGAQPLAEVAGCGLVRSADDAASRALADAGIGASDIDWLLSDAADALDISGRAHLTELIKVLGDCGAATAMLGVALVALAVGEGKPPAGLGLARAPRNALVVSADDFGAAAIVLKKPTD